jgi:hypothetical protein
MIYTFLVKMYLPVLLIKEVDITEYLALQIRRE